MNKADRQKFYDEEIFPALAELQRRCHENGLSFLAAVEWAKGDLGITMHYVHPYGPQMDWAAMAARSGGNADTLIGHMMIAAKADGHDSTFLKQLGVPFEPQD